jgi:hypothetical protein
VMATVCASTQLAGHVHHGRQVREAARHRDVGPVQSRDLIGPGVPMRRRPTCTPSRCSCRQCVVSVDHGFALSNPALVSARSKKVVLQRQLSDLGVQRRQVHRGHGLAAACEDVRGALPQRRFHLMTWLACSSNSLRSSAIVLSSRKAANATRALNAGLWVRRLRRAIS